MRQKTSRSTIKEVALAAGVSTQTVSRVINERPDVSPETRKRVQEVIDQLAYRPSAVARSLIRQRSHTLGVVTAGLKYIGPSRILSGIASAVEEAGYSLLLKELSDFDTKEIEPIFESFLSRHVDGIIWAVPEVGDNRTWVKEASLDVEIPLVYLTMHAQENISVVSVDNYLGGKMAVSHLLEQGFKNIGHISGPLDWWEARQRMTAWKDVLKENGIKAKDEHSVEGDWSLSSGIEATKKLLNQYPDVDAIFVANDQMALSAIQYLRQHGRRVPEDIGIVGFDDIPESEFFFPPLTTIQQDQNTVAKLAVEDIIKTIESGWHKLEPKKPQTIIVPPTLVVRQSSLYWRGVDEKEVNIK
ncbi:MAG: LacI family DNA-binding transcriptional regulator [Anaerolineales bacterium]|nr:LacI family DNA-binding transcriptional regulator [Anaerolineales bacterium]MBX3037863.1 LacI family DNA-binding transcriptional regulator [Anaerolineales bacterium]